MAIINCPECSKEISDTVKTCPNCGFSIKKQKNKKSKKKALIITTSIIGIFIIAFVIVGFITYDSVKPTIEAISNIGTVTNHSVTKIERAQNLYDNLSPIQKIFVYNSFSLNKAQKELESMPIDLTTENIEDYLGFNVVFSDLKNSTGLFTKTATANMDITCTPLKNMYFEDVSITFEFSFLSGYSDDFIAYIGWEIPEQTIKISTDGKGNKTTQISYEDMIYTARIPNEKCCKIKSVTGSVYKSKP